jgi:hypothetical protein
MCGFRILGLVAVVTLQSAWGLQFNSHQKVQAIDDYALTKDAPPSSTGVAVPVLNQKTMHPLAAQALKTPLIEGKKRQVAGPFGLFSTGTNFVCQLFLKNKLPGGCNFYRCV